MSEKQTLSTWLRSRGVYQDDADPDTDVKRKRWRDDLLSEFESEPMVSLQKTAVETDRGSPLEVHHLVAMMPVGLGLFALGWLFGSQVVSMEQIARVSSWVWVGVSVVGSLGFLFWRRQIVGWMQR